MVLMAPYLVQDLGDARQGVRGGSAAWGLLAKGVRDLLWTEAVRHGAGWRQPRNRGGGCDLPMRTRGRARGAAAGLTSLKYGSGLTYGCRVASFGVRAQTQGRQRRPQFGARGGGGRQWTDPTRQRERGGGPSRRGKRGERKEAGPD